jgi:hypothetical protein
MKNECKAMGFLKYLFICVVCHQDQSVLTPSTKPRWPVIFNFIERSGKGENRCARLEEMMDEAGVT